MLYSCMQLCARVVSCALLGANGIVSTCSLQGEDRMDGEASRRDMSVAMAVAAHWWWVTPLRKKQSSHLTHPTAMANLPSLPRASDRVLTVPFPPTWKSWRTETKAGHFSVSGGHHEQDWDTSTTVPSQSLCCLLLPASIPLPWSCRLPSRRTCVGMYATQVDEEGLLVVVGEEHATSVCFRRG